MPEIEMTEEQYAYLRAANASLYSARYRYPRREPYLVPAKVHRLDLAVPAEMMFAALDNCYAERDACRARKERAERSKAAA
jgi:hypothetical protein